MMQDLKVKVYGVFNVTKKQFLIVEGLLFVLFVGLTVYTFIHYDKPWNEYEGDYDQWAARYSVYIWIGCIAMCIMESQFYLHRFTKAQLEIISTQKREIEQQKEEITCQRDEIEAQKEEIISQRDLVTEQRDKITQINRDMTDSIHYAKRIQSAILPTKDFSAGLFPDSFILFRPKDIVSGDFYWMAKVENIRIIAAADCTGHGVPGAFMSMLGAAFLNEIVTKEYITHPGIILKRLRKQVVSALHQQGNEITEGQGNNVKDGLDISLCAIDQMYKKVQFAGANNPLYLISNSASLVVNGAPFNSAAEVSGKYLYEIKGDKMPIGIYEKMDNFNMHEIDVKKGDCLYLFSDGFADQFGGSKGKKYKYKRLKEKILEVCTLPMKDQGENLSRELEDWLNPVDTNEKYEQIDDITIIGLRL